MSFTPSKDRLLSVDVFRGLCVAGMILVDNPGDDDRAFWMIQHAKWNGWTPADFIFPSFVFLVGVAIVISFSRRIERGEARSSIFLHALKRSAILIFIGILVNGFPTFPLATWRIEGVLQRIAVCYLFSAILVLWSGWRGQLAGVALCLIGYWALLRFVPVPGFGVPGRDIPFLDPERNLVAWLDRKLFMGRLYDGGRDPEGMISNIPAIGTCLLGVLTGQWLKSSRSPGAKVIGMLAAGIVGLIAGLSSDHWFPINKNLWTSSFVLLTAGFALTFLALLYWFTEVRNWRGRWTMPFLVFGMNAIAGFVADALVYGPGYSFNAKLSNGSTLSWHEFAQTHLVACGLSPTFGSLVYSLAAVAFCWFLLWLLWRKDLFLKI